MRQRDDELRARRRITREDWRSAAACLPADSELFFPLSDSGMSVEQAARAKAICAGCPVRGDCLAFAVRTGQAHGIWGGMTAGERAVIRRGLLSGEWAARGR
jgi:WhiB family transcriptional regulator, redox-sensing transcriptional regulator